MNNSRQEMVQVLYDKDGNPATPLLLITEAQRLLSENEDAQLLWEAAQRLTTRARAKTTTQRSKVPAYAKRALEAAGISLEEARKMDETQLGRVPGLTPKGRKWVLQGARYARRKSARSS